jgi:hypothetical protein
MRSTQVKKEPTKEKPAENGPEQATRKKKEPLDLDHAHSRQKAKKGN